MSTPYPTQLVHQCGYCRRPQKYSINRQPGMLRPIVVHLHCGCGCDWVLTLKKHKDRSVPGKSKVYIEARSQNVPKKPYVQDIRNLPWIGDAAGDGPSPL